MRQKDILSFLDLYMRREQKVAISLIIIYCSTTHATFFFYISATQEFCVNLSILCTHNWSNRLVHAHKKYKFSFLLFSSRVYLPAHDFSFFYEFRLSIELQQCNNTTIYGYFSPYFQGHCSPIANSFFHAYQNETKLA